MDAGLGGRGGSSNMVMGAVRKQHMNIALWFGFFTASFVVFYLFSDGDFSFLMTFASFTRGFGFAVLLGLMLAKKHARGVSMKSLQLYAVVFASRLVSVLQHEGYLPYDRSGDFVYHGAEIASLALAVGCVVLMSTKFKSTYQQDVDSFGALHVPTEWGTLYIFVPCLLLAMVMHPNLNKNFLSDTAWTFSMYLESMAIVPQLFMFQKQAKGIVEVLVSVRPCDAVVLLILAWCCCRCSRCCPAVVQMLVSLLRDAPPSKDVTGFRAENFSCAYAFFQLGTGPRNLCWTPSVDFIRTHVLVSRGVQ
ncbi:unnamed protein product [Ectocarpus sp. 12 AP-2014]